MRKRRLLGVGAAAALCALAGAALVSALADLADDDYAFAVIGDTPYGQTQFDSFPAHVAQINADPDVQLVSHLGDIKQGSSVCSDEYFNHIKSDFARFVDPLVYTPGDNEWTDCHGGTDSRYNNPLERLAKIRQVFFPTPGQTLGQHSATVTSQAGNGLPENVRWQRADVAFAALHVVGSNNDLAPWTGLGQTAATPEQEAENRARTSAAVAEIGDTFADARTNNNRAVVLLTQADMFLDDAQNQAQFQDAFRPIVQEIAKQSADFGGPVYLFNGDSHKFKQDNPLAEGSTWLSTYGVSQSAANLTRVTVDGGTIKTEAGATVDNATNYLRVRVNSEGPNVLSWERIPYTA